MPHKLVSAACGMWLSTQRLFAAVVDEHGRAAPSLQSPLNDDEQCLAVLDYLDRHHGLDVELVLPEDFVRNDNISRLALETGRTLWAAPYGLVNAIRRASGFAETSPARIAAMIARLAIVPGFQGHLRRVDCGLFESRQLRLL